MEQDCFHLQFTGSKRDSRIYSTELEDCKSCYNKSTKKTFFNLRSLKRQLNCSDSLTEDDVEKIAEP